MNAKDEMVRVLKEETAVAESLEQLLKAKQQAFVQWNSGELNDTVKKEEELLLQLSLLEKERITIFRALNPDWQGKQEGAMKEYLAHYPSPELQEQYERLKNISLNVMRRNKLNKQLLQSSLSFVHNTLKAITGNYQRQLLDQKI